MSTAMVIAGQSVHLTTLFLGRLEQAVNEILCDDSTSCKEACDNNDYHRSRQQQTFNMSVKSMRNSLDHFIYCIFL